jgi:uncharacterized membrane protein
MRYVNEISTSKTHETNIEKIVQLEAEQERRVPPANRLAEAIGKFAGTPAFVWLQLACVGLWVLFNSGAFAKAFDPYPFYLLEGLLALEAVLLTSFVLIRQNRMSQMADERGHLDLQINLLAEKEITKVIQLLQRMSKQMGIEELVTDPEAREFSKDTAVEDVAHDLRENLDKDSLKKSQS